VSIGMFAVGLLLSKVMFAIVDLEKCFPTALAQGST
jgi:hypothetical protein